MKFLDKNLSLLIVVIVAMLMLLPFLGLSDFNTKGEPREAVVALSMLKDGNWILPVNNGMDIPYKPPFFHYCIAVLSLLTGGVNEYTSRLPSALSLIAMTICCFCFYRKRMSTNVAVASALLLLTSFEVHRAGTNCRVDMMLTAFTVGALLLLYRWWERGSHGVPVLAVLCMSCATLTKGPVGFILPCFVMGVFMLLRGEHFWKTFFKFVCFGLLSCILPLMWYVAAWIEGGQHFLDLVYEENIGRMTGSMSYESHEHSFPYNFFTLSTGWLPWTLLLLFSLFAKPWKGLKCRKTGEKLRIRIMQIPPVKLFTWLSFLLVLFFYCLPSSKRSVYLLPCYPFMAVLIAQYIEWLWNSNRRGVLRTYVCVIASIGVIITLVYGALRFGLVPDTIFHGKHAAQNLAMLHALRDTQLGLLPFILMLLPLITAADSIYLAFGKHTRDKKHIMAYCLFMPLVVLMMALDGIYQPTILNTKSLRPMAEYIQQTFPNEPLYQFVNDPMMHFFGADFYLGDKLDQFEKPVRTMVNNKVVVEKKTPTKGVLVVSEDDFKVLAERHPEYIFVHVSTSKGRISELKENISFYRFSVK